MDKKCTRDDLYDIDTQGIYVDLADCIFCMTFCVETLEPEYHRVCRTMTIIILGPKSQ